MTQKRWNTTEVSAYLDGALGPRDQVALETQMTRDPALQRRVEEMRQVVVLMESAPLRQTPRNYLLSPAMVAERKPAPKTGRVPLLMMRLATSLVALAFVITFGLNVLQSSSLFRTAMAPEMATSSDAQPEAALLLSNGAEKQEELPPAEAMADALEAPVAREAPAPEAMATQAIEEPAALAAPALTEELAERVAEGEILGMGEIASDELTEDSAERSMGALAESEIEMVTEEEAAVEMLELAEEAASSPSAEGEAPVDIAEDSFRSAEPLESKRTTLSPWITVGLGLSTAILAAITIWLSRRDVG